MKTNLISKGLFILLLVLGNYSATDADYGDRNGSFLVKHPTACVVRVLNDDGLTAFSTKTELPITITCFMNATIGKNYEVQSCGARRDIIVPLNSRITIDFTN